MLCLYDHHNKKPISFDDNDFFNFHLQRTNCSCPSLKSPHPSPFFRNGQPSRCSLPFCHPTQFLSLWHSLQMVPPSPHITSQPSVSFKPFFNNCVPHHLFTEESSTLRIRIEVRPAKQIELIIIFMINIASHFRAFLVSLLMASIPLPLISMISIPTGSSRICSGR